MAGGASHQPFSLCCLSAIPTRDISDSGIDHGLLRLTDHLNQPDDVVICSELCSSDEMGRAKRATGLSEEGNCRPHWVSTCRFSYTRQAGFVTWWKIDCEREG